MTAPLTIRKAKETEYNAVRACGMKALRLDVLTGNVPAEKLYEGAVFRYVDTVKLFYEDTGRVDFNV